MKRQKHNMIEIEDRLIDAIRAMGGSYRANTANTGTQYITAEFESETGEIDDELGIEEIETVVIKIRIADHGECYCTEDISIDPDNLGLAQAVTFIADKLGVEDPEVPDLRVQVTARPDWLFEVAQYDAEMARELGLSGPGFFVNETNGAQSRTVAGPFESCDQAVAHAATRGELVTDWE